MKQSTTMGESVPTSDVVIQGKKVAQWELEWQRRAGGFTGDRTDLRHKIGLLRAVLNGTVMYIGVATEHKGGLAKRIADFVRESNSARKTFAGQKIHESRHVLELEVLLISAGANARSDAKQLKSLMLMIRRPEWNQRQKPIKAARSARNID